MPQLVLIFLIGLYYLNCLILPRLPRFPKLPWWTFLPWFILNIFFLYVYFFNWSPWSPKIIQDHQRLPKIAPDRPRWPNSLMHFLCQGVLECCSLQFLHNTVKKMFLFGGAREHFVLKKNCVVKFSQKGTFFKVTIFVINPWWRWFIDYI